MADAIVRYYKLVHMHPGLKITPYITNRSRLKVFVVVEMNCNSLENICSWPVTWYPCVAKLCCTVALLLFHWKSFTVTNVSAISTTVFHFKRNIHSAYDNVW